ncbi:MAG: antitermination protein NusG [Halioglobus sp.]|nr:antitermination protein NusG [Halioglobus sp.]
MEAAIEFIFRWAHVLFGITWIGMLYYFNFVQTEYFKEAEKEAALPDAKAKLAPRALWWFRWGAMFTFLTGLYLIYSIGAHNSLAGNYPVIWMGALAGIFMFLNVWLIIWPNQQIVLGLNGKTGDGPAAAAKAGLASRTNTLFSGPMLFGMLGSKHLYIQDPGGVGFWASVVLILALEANALFGKTGPMTSVKGVIHCSIALTAVIWALLAFL